MTSANGIDFKGVAISSETQRLGRAQMISGYALTTVKTNNIDFVVMSN